MGILESYYIFLYLLYIYYILYIIIYCIFILQKNYIFLLLFVNHN